MILTDTKKSQAKTVIGLDSVAGVSVTSFKDGLFSLHLNEVSELPGCRPSDCRRWWVSRGGGWAGGDGDQTSHSGPSVPLRLFLWRENESCPFTLFPLPKISSVGSKGDFLLVSEHVIELLTKMYRAVLDATQKQLPVTVTEE